MEIQEHIIGPNGSRADAVKVRAASLKASMRPLLCGCASQLRSGERELELVLRRFVHLWKACRESSEARSLEGCLRMMRSCQSPWPRRISQRAAETRGSRPQRRFILQSPRRRRKHPNSGVHLQQQIGNLEPRVYSLLHMQTFVAAQGQLTHAVGQCRETNTKAQS